MRPFVHWCVARSECLACVLNISSLNDLMTIQDEDSSDSDDDGGDEEGTEE